MGPYYQLSFELRSPVQRCKETISQLRGVSKAQRHLARVNWINRQQAPIYPRTPLPPFIHLGVHAADAKRLPGNWKRTLRVDCMYRKLIERIDQILSTQVQSNSVRETERQRGAEVRERWKRGGGGRRGAVLSPFLSAIAAAAGIQLWALGAAAECRCEAINKCTDNKRT